MRYSFSKGRSQIFFGFFDHLSLSVDGFYLSFDLPLSDSEYYGVKLAILVSRQNKNDT
jgi:hypothetical protein